MQGTTIKEKIFLSQSSQNFCNEKDLVSFCELAKGKKKGGQGCRKNLGDYSNF